MFSIIRDFITKIPAFAGMTVFVIIIFIVLSNSAFGNITNDTTMTNWQIQPSFKYDVLCFLNTLTADSFYLTYYKDEYSKFQPKLTDKVKKSLAHLKKVIKDENGGIISANLCLYFSATDDSTLEQMKQTVQNNSTMKSNFMNTPYYSDDDWKIFESVKNDLSDIFDFLMDIDFYTYWKTNILPKVESKIAETEPNLPNYDVIRENEFYLGFKLPSNTITIYMLNYSQPHGIKITGTRFLTDIAWPFNIVLRNAVHEMMHPPYDYKNDSGLRDAIETLKNDDYFMDKVLHHNASFGYNSLDGFVEEDCVQALDQTINEKLGVAYDAKLRWQRSDDGMHVLAMTLYTMIKEHGYDKTGGNFRDFFVNLINSGKLRPGTIKTYSDALLN